MKHNMGNVERVARIVAGVIVMLFSLTLLHGFGVLYGVVTSVSLTGLALTALGIVFFVTGFTGNCVLYRLLRFNTCRLCRDGAEHV